MRRLAVWMVGRFRPVLDMGNSSSAEAIGNRPDRRDRPDREPRMGMGMGDGGWDGGLVAVLYRTRTVVLCGT